METIFIDTSIFEANNFLEGKRIQEIYKLAERGDIKVVIPRSTYHEILNRISKKIDEAFQKFNKYREDTRVLRNALSISYKFEPFDRDKIENELNKILNERFLKSKFEIIDYPTLNIEEIFKLYFEKKFPFGSGGKKNEFPDAFALKAIEMWAESQRIKVKAFSKDNDMINYKSEHLEIIEDFELYLSNKIKELESVKHQKRLEQIDHIIKYKSQIINENIKNWVESQLYDESKYNEYSNYYEIHEISISELYVDIEDYRITSITDKYISVELKVSIHYKVEIIIDDENYMYKDDETKEMVFLETKPVLLDKVRDIVVDLIFDIEKDNDTVYEPVLEDINRGKKLNI